MKKNPPDVLLAMGSYASVGPVIAARFLQVPVALHEGNVIPGKAVVFLSRYASTVALSSRATSAKMKCSKVVFTGFPVLETRPQDNITLDPRPCDFVVLIMGGSQGADFINKVAPRALSEFKGADKLYVIHLCGKSSKRNIEQQYEQAGIRAVVLNHLQDIYKAYQVADISVGRAGAASCAELIRFAVPSIIIPHPSAGGGHQRANASEMEKTGGFIMLTQNSISAGVLGEHIRRLMEDRELRRKMKGSLEMAADDSAAVRLGTLIEDIGKKKLK